MLCKRHGHEIVALGNLCPVLDDTDELDSYMYQTVGHQLVTAWAACTGLPLFRGRLHGSSKQQASASTLSGSLFHSNVRLAGWVSMGADPKRQLCLGSHI